MALKVLIAEGDKEWAANAVSALSDEGYEVNHVADGKKAQLAIYNDKYFAVILNLAIKNHSGVQVLKFIQSNYPGLKIVLLVDSKEFLEEHDLDEERLTELGINEYLIKPFEFPKLFDVLDGEQNVTELMSHVKKKEGQSEETEIQEADDNFTGIPIDQFFNSKHMLFDIYVKIADSKYVKILHAGDTFTKERVDKYKNEKNVEHLYFHKKDRLKFIRWNNYFGSKITEMENIPQKLKVNFMKNLTEKYLDEVGTKGLKPLVFEQGKEVCENIFKMCEQDQDLWKLLRDLTELDPKSFSHSYLICLYASMLIKQFEWQSKAILETTALAAMLHDIGKSKMPPELMDKRPEDMTDEEIKEYHKHPMYAVEMLNEVKSVNPAVKQIVLQHHESGDGNGFPFGLKDHKILTLSKIIFLCDEFVQYILVNDVTPIEGIKQMVADRARITRYNGVILESFMKVFISPQKLQAYENEK